MPEPHAVRRRRPALYVTAVVVAWSAGLLFAGAVGRGLLAVLLALPLAAILAIRTESATAEREEREGV